MVKNLGFILSVTGTHLARLSRGVRRSRNITNVTGWSDGEWTVGGGVEAGRRGGFPALATRGIWTRKDRDAPLSG